MNNFLTAQDLAQQGRYGDTTLVHMNPQEVQGLQSLALANGTTMTRNPNTGMPEAFSLSGFIPMIAGGALSAAGLSPLAAGLLVGGATAAIEGDLGSGFMAGLGASGGSSLFNSIKDLGALSQATGQTTGETFSNIAKDQIASTANPATAFGASQAPGTGMMGINSSPFESAFTQGGGGYDPAIGAMRGNVPGSLPTGVNTVNSANTGNYFKSAMENPYVRDPNSLGVKAEQIGQNISESTGEFGRGLKSLTEPGGWDRAKQIWGGSEEVVQYGPNGEIISKTVKATPLNDFEAAFKFTPVATGALAGLEESDIYGDPIPIPEDKRFYSEDGRLNLSGPTSLRLPMYAKEGGSVSSKTAPSGGGGLFGRIWESGNTRGTITNNSTGKVTNTSGMSLLDMLRQAGVIRYADGGIASLTPEQGRMLNGMGDGVSDDIPANIEGEQEAALSDGEFIVPARIVSELGNGSSDAGAEKLYAMIDRIQGIREQTMGDRKEYAKDTNAERFLPA